MWAGVEGERLHYELQQKKQFTKTLTSNYTHKLNIIIVFQNNNYFLRCCSKAMITF